MHVVRLTYRFFPDLCNPLPSRPFSTGGNLLRCLRERQTWNKTPCTTHLTNAMQNHNETPCKCVECVDWEVILWNLTSSGAIRWIVQFCDCHHTKHQELASSLPILLLVFWFQSSSFLDGRQRLALSAKQSNTGFKQRMSSHSYKKKTKSLWQQPLESPEKSVQSFEKKKKTRSVLHWAQCKWPPTTSDFDLPKKIYGRKRKKKPCGSRKGNSFQSRLLPTNLWIVVLPKCVIQHGLCSSHLFAWKRNLAQNSSSQMYVLIWQTVTNDRTFSAGCPETSKRSARDVFTDYQPVISHNLSIIELESLRRQLSHSLLNHFQAAEQVRTRFGREKSSHPLCT